MPITIRPMPDGYPRDCWIVTGAIWANEVRYYRKLSDAKKYARKLAKSILPLDINITIEERQSDLHHYIIEKD